MSQDLQIAVKRHAFCIALKAKIGELLPLDVEQLRSNAEQILKNDPLMADITTFASLYEVHRHDAKMLRQLGEDLERAVEISTMPVPVDGGRKDIYG